MKNLINNQKTEKQLLFDLQEQYSNDLIKCIENGDFKEAKYYASQCKKIDEKLKNL